MPHLGLAGGLVMPHLGHTGCVLMPDRSPGVARATGHITLEPTKDANTISVDTLLIIQEIVEIQLPNSFVSHLDLDQTGCINAYYYPY